MTKLRISQIFGPTFQGEGSAAGRHCLFLRTYDCNLTCHFCDTPYTWANTEARAAEHRDGIVYAKEVEDNPFGMHIMDGDEILQELKWCWDYTTHPTIIVISGGEPMMQQQGLAPIAANLKHYRNEIHVETAGTIAPQYEFGQLVTQFNVSPKLASSGNLLTKRYKPEVLRLLVQSGKAWFKFVVGDKTMEQDFEEIEKIVQACQIQLRRVMVMPEGITPTGTIESAQKLADEALKRGYGLTMRQHILLWGDDPGR